MKKILLSIVQLVIFTGILKAQLPDERIYLHLKKICEVALDLKMDLKIAEFTEWQSGKKIPSVVITGEKIMKPDEDPVTGLCGALEREGWNSNYEYSADGPDGTVFSYIRERTVCVFDISWSPGHEDGLSEEEEERLAKEPLTYNITLYCFIK